MKVRVLNNGKIYEAKYYKDLNDKQKELNNSDCFEPMDIFIDDTDDDDDDEILNVAKMKRGKK